MVSKNTLFCQIHRTQYEDLRIRYMSCIWIVSLIYTLLCLSDWGNILDWHHITLFVSFWCYKHFLLHLIYHLVFINLFSWWIFCAIFTDIVMEKELSKTKGTFAQISKGTNNYWIFIFYFDLFVINAFQCMFRSDTWT